ncbi:MAG: hybrid sensor histidine kinase/response regulator [Desulfuromonas sp.]|uniref:MASE3 domain-containing protein n=1 Tax=Desulfuromonas sp. TaxID=892 RepID=UPI000CA8FB3E|nr:MASE3 domain-containing protein [Desulfuromonas sp.]PLX83873.1 MAG: hybrid sensor histidine kinase/response regulator [Desulfuromonas sp.]
MDDGAPTTRQVETGAGETVAPPHRSGLRSRLTLAGLGALGLVLLFPLSRHNYLLFHGIVEILSVAVAFTVFSIGWNSRSFSRNNALQLLAVSFLVVGALDFLHVLAYKGMGVFPGRGSDLPTQLWVAARYVQSLSFLLAALVLGRPRPVRPLFLLGVYLLVGVTLVTVIVPLRIFPACFVEGTGLTPFKVGSEYLISGLLGLSGALFWRKRAAINGRILTLLLGAVAVTILAELSFTLYADVFGFFNFLGHVFKLLSIVLVYAALVQGSLRTPYESLFRGLARSERELKAELVERSRIEKALRESEERFRTLIETTPEGIVENDLAGVVTFSNRAHHQILGFDEGELLGGAIWATLPTEESRRELRDFLAHLVAEQPPPESFEARNRTRDGRLVDLQVDWNYKRDVRGEVIGFVSVITDITERKRARQELERAKEAAEAANRAKGAFLANMSHEIRTPMNAIIGMTDLTLGTGLEREQREWLGMVKTSAESLLRVINDILDFSKIEAGMLELDSRSFDLRETVEGTVEVLAVQAHQKGLELACHIAPEVPWGVVGDAGRLRQVLINLVGNAIKFTAEGEVVLRVEQEPDGPASGHCLLKFTVSDTGIGIPADKMDRIFRSFTQVDGSTSRTHGGTGLGLSISRQIVELMGGTVGVESVEGRGSTFHFTLDFPMAIETPPAASDVLTPQLRGLRTLVVDDHATSRLFLEKVLTRWGLEVTLAGGGEQGLRALRDAGDRRNPFQLLLLDSGMPGMYGFALAEQIRPQRDMTGPALMMVTTEDVGRAAARCRDLDIACYLVKPLRQSELFNGILASLESPAGAPAAKGVPPVGPVPVGAGEGSGLPEVPLRVLLAEDNPINQKLARALLEARGWKVTAVSNGAEVVRQAKEGGVDLVLMDVQMPEMDGLDATRAIRRLEGSAGTVPIIGLTAHAMKGDREIFLSAGMDDYVAKPIKPEELFGAIVRCLDPARPSPVPTIDLSPTLEALNGNRTFLDELVGDFLRDCPGQLDRMRRALEEGNEEQLERLAHNLKSVAGIFGAQAAIMLADELETLGEAGKLAGAPGVLERLERELGRVCDCLART